MSITIIAYLLLSNGITISSINLPNLKVERLYIKLDKKLILQAKKINATFSSKSDNSGTETIYSLIRFMKKNFHSVTIEELYLNDHKVTFSYNESPNTSDENVLVLTSKETALTLNYHVYDDFITIVTPLVTYKPTQTAIEAKAVIDLNNSSTYALLTAKIKENSDLNIFFKDNGTAFAFATNTPSLDDISDIVNLFNLEKSTSKWIVDYNKAENYQLIEAKGIFEYSNPTTLEKTLFLHAREANTSYLFNQKVSPVHAEYIDVYYTKGILDIKPHALRYHDHLIDNGNVYIDFNPEHIMLGVELNTNATISQDIIDIVNAYDITLPLLQKSGSTDAHLKIEVDLVTEKALASGEFYIKESEVALNTRVYSIKDAEINFNNDHLYVPKARLSYKDMLYSDLNGILDLHTLTGNFFFDINKVDLEKSGLKELKLLDKSLHMSLNISKESEEYIFSKSNWTYKDYNLTTTSTRLGLSHEPNSIGTLETLKIHIPQLGSLEINGTIANKKSNFNINLFDFYFHDKDFTLATTEKTLPLQLSIEDNVTQLYLPLKTLFKLNDMPLEVMPTSILFSEGYLDLNNASINLKDKFSSEFSAHYKLGSNGVRLDLKNTKFFTGEYLHIKPKFTLFYEHKDTKHNFHINKYNMHAAIYDKNIFALNIKDVSKLYPHSKMMQKFDIKSGSVNLVFMEDKTDVAVFLKDFHPLLSKNDKEITDYNIEGTYKDNIAKIRINNNLNLVYDTKGKVTASNIDFNLFPILSYLKYIDTNDEKSTLELSMQTQNCNVSLGYSKRKILADSINIDITPSNIQAYLTHKSGGVVFQSHDNNFSAYGNGLNDSFMNSLFKFSRFKGGDLSFVMQGRFDDFNGYIQTNDTIMKDYTILNNTLAFINTIPSLITFSIPGYSNQGIKVKEMYTSFHKKNSKLFIEEAKITSKELIITASGELDFDKERVDALVEVKTDIGSAAKDIPLVGYIIFGEDTVSTAVHVHGDLKDPDVESASAIAKSVYSAPWNIIKRTVTLPLKLLDIFDDENATK